MHILSGYSMMRKAANGITFYQEVAIHNACSLWLEHNGGKPQTFYQKVVINNVHSLGLEYDGGKPQVNVRPNCEGNP